MMIQQVVLYVNKWIGMHRKISVLVDFVDLANLRNTYRV